MRLPPLTTESRGAPRWALSFADLCLVLLGFMLLLQAHRGNPALLSAGLRAAFGAAPSYSVDETAAPLFEPGEAVLLEGARTRFAEFGREAMGRHASVRVDSIGTDADARRFDAWELAAARTAAIARAIQSGGLGAERIDLSITGTGSAGGTRAQHIRVTMTSARD